MMGMVFTSFVEMVEKHYSASLADSLLSAAELPNQGAYTAIGYYPFEQIQRLLGLLCQHTGEPADVLLRMFGAHLFDDIIASHKHVLGTISTLLDLLEHLDSNIHREVYKLYPGAQLPRFTVIARGEQVITLRYQSPRMLEPLAAGLIDGAAAYFGTPVDVRMETRTPGDTLITVHITAVTGRLA
jgi:hypothetical protein